MSAVQLPEGPGIVWLASYPKSGNTWVRTFLSNYFRETHDEASINDLYGGPIASSRVLFDHATGLEAANMLTDEIECLRPDAYRWLLRMHSHARFMKTHDAWKVTKTGDPLFPADVSRGAIYIVRNPLDVAVSSAHHYGQPVEVAAENLMNEHFGLSAGRRDLPLQLPQFMGTWTNHVKSWIERCSLPVHLMRYEDMLGNSSKAFSEMLRFIGVEPDEVQLADAITSSSFDKLRDQESVQGFRERRLRSTAPFFRKGVAGGWREDLPQHMVAKLIDAHRESMQALGYLDADDQPGY